MATSKVACWTVLVVVEEDDNLTGMYKMTPTTTLSELIQVWKDDFDLFGHWVLKSANEDVIYHDGSLTLEMIGATVSRAPIVTLRAELSSETTGEIFVYLKDKRHHLFVEPQEKLYRVLSRLPRTPECFEYNGLPLNIKHSVQQAGLQHKSVIYESLSSVTVRLSSGCTRIFQIPSNSLVWQLKEEVGAYEAGDFSLRYLERYLKPDESIRQLKEVVDVTTAEFVVHVNGRRVSWRSKAEPIRVPEFVSQLMAIGGFDAHNLETFEFVCAGCQRRICHSEDDVQQLPIDCCKERSLNLNAMAPPGTGANLGTNDAAKHIQCLHEYLVKCRGKNSRSEGSRGVCREMKKQLAVEMLDYNIITQCSEKLLRRIHELENKIRKLEAYVEAAKTKNAGTEESLKEEIEKLCKENRKLGEENRKLGEEKRKLCKENKKLGEENWKLGEENKKLQEEESGVSQIKYPQGATGGELFSEQLGAKLMVIYRPRFFSVTSHPWVQHRGEFNGFQHFIKCQMPGIHEGMISSNNLRDVLHRLLSGGEIGAIYQFRGFANGNRVAEATTSDGDEYAEDIEATPFCDIDGVEYTWEESGKPDELKICSGCHVFICGGGRTTVLQIWT